MLLSLATIHHTHKNIFRSLLVVFCLSLFVKLIMLGALLSSGGEKALLLGDSKRYLYLAEQIVAGNGYTYNGFSETFRPPGYPLYLSLFLLFNIPLWYASLIQIVLSSFLPVMVLYFGRRFVRIPPLFCFIAALLCALEPVQNYNAVMLMPDAFFAILFMSLVFFLARWFEDGNYASIIFASIILGISNYLRPAGIYLAALIVVVTVIYFGVHKRITKDRLIQIGLLIVIPLIIIAPWCMRNYSLFKTYSFVSMVPNNLYIYVGIGTKAAAEGKTYHEAYVEMMNRARSEIPEPVYFSSFKNAEYLKSRTIEIVKEYPGSYLSTYLLGLNTLWFSNNYHYFLQKYGFITLPTSRPSFSMLLAGGGPSAVMTELRNIGGEPYVVIAILGKLLWILFSLGAVLGAILSFLKNRNTLAIVFLLLIIYFSATILSTGIGVEQRHRYPMNPLIFTFFVAMAYSLYETYLHWRSSL